MHPPSFPHTRARLGPARPGSAPPVASIPRNRMHHAVMPRIYLPRFVPTDSLFRDSRRERMLERMLESRGAGRARLEVVPFFFFFFCSLALFFLDLLICDQLPFRSVENKRRKINILPGNNSGD